MKFLSHSYIYWPNEDDNVTKFIRQCTQAVKSPTKATLKSWSLTVKQWQRVYIDFGDPIDGYYYFVIVEAYFK